MNKILGVILIGLMVNGCSSTTIPKPTAIKPIATPTTIATPVVTKAIDWSKIDKADTVLVDNFRQPSTLTHFSKMAVPFAMKDFNVSETQAIRILAMQSELVRDKVLTKILSQLGSDYAHGNWGFGTPDSKGVTLRSPTLDDEEVVKNYRLVIMTKPHVKAETHNYIFTTGNAKGYSLPIQILPIARRSNKEILAIYGNEQRRQAIVNLIKKYEGEYQAMGIGTMQKVEVSIYFPKGTPDKVVLDKLQRELVQLTDLEINIQVLQRRIEAA